jgi:ABC-type phosphate transport system auxiliary subunit
MAVIVIGLMAVWAVVGVGMGWPAPVTMQLPTERLVRDGVISHRDAQSSLESPGLAADGEAG